MDDGGTSDDGCISILFVECRQSKKLLFHIKQEVGIPSFLVHSTIASICCGGSEAKSYSLRLLLFPAYSHFIVVILGNFFVTIVFPFFQKDVWPIVISSHFRSSCTSSTSLLLCTDFRLRLALVLSFLIRLRQLRLSHRVQDHGNMDYVDILVLHIY